MFVLYAILIVFVFTRLNFKTYKKVEVMYCNFYKSEFDIQKIIEVKPYSIGGGGDNRWVKSQDLSQGC